MAPRRSSLRRAFALLAALASVAFGAGVQADESPAAGAVTEPASGGLVDADRSASQVAVTIPRVLMVGDSTLAGVRNVTAAQRLFVGFDPVLDAQGCRRLVWPSCFSDSDFRTPNTVEEAILGTPGVVDVVVVMSGYNDWHDPFGSFVDTIMRAARAKGAQQVVWLTLSTGQRPESSATAIEVFAENTQMLWDSVPRNPDLAVADWRTYNQRSIGWLSDDGVHLRTRGAYGLADYITRWVAHLYGRPCPAPIVPGGRLSNPCPNPDTMGRVPDITALYGV